MLKIDLEVKILIFKVSRNTVIEFLIKQEITNTHLKDFKVLIDVKTKPNSKHFL